MLIDPEWEMLPVGLEYRCATTDSTVGPTCDEGAAADAPPHGYTGVADVPNIRAGIRSTKFNCNAPDDGLEADQSNQDEDRYAGDERSKEVCKASRADSSSR